jgi:hypothetical protein
MRLDFWNNPIIVSAFRVKYRRGGLFHLTTLYMLLLVVGGAVLNYYNQHLGNRPWQQNYFIALMGLQFFLSPLLAAVATAGSMKAEVVNRTLDFQRIAALSPPQILLGKLLGEPSLSYLLAVATIPLAVWCWALGVPGVGLIELCLLYFNLLTTTLLFGSIGLLNRLEVPEGKLSGGGSSGGAVWGWLLLSVYASIGTGIASTTTPWYAVPTALPTPVLIIFGTAKGDPWLYDALLYGRPLAYLVLTPVVQLIVAALCFQMMVRRLINPLNTPFAKRTAYASVLLADVLAVAVLYDRSDRDVGLTCTRFCLIHLGGSLALLAAVTPRRETLVSWVWRYRGRRPRWLDLWLGARSENTLVLPTVCGIGVVMLGGGLLLPAGLSRGWPSLQPMVGTVVAATGLTCVLILASGALSQWLEFTFSRGAGGYYVSLLGFAVSLPHLLGDYFHLDWLLALSPSAYYAQLFDFPGLAQREPLPLWPVLSLYGLFTVVIWLHFQYRLGRLEKGVDHQLLEMGVFNGTRKA